MAAESWDELETCLQKADLAPSHCKGGLELDLRWLAVVWRPGQRSFGPNMWRLNNSFQVGPGCFALYGPAWRLRFKWRSAVGGGGRSERWRETQSQAWCETWAGMFQAPPSLSNYIRFNWISRLAISDVRISMFTFCTSLKTLTPRHALRYWASQRVVCVCVHVWHILSVLYILATLLMPCFPLKDAQDLRSSLIPLKYDFYWPILYFPTTTEQSSSASSFNGASREPTASQSSICTHHMFARSCAQLLNRLSDRTKNTHLSGQLNA